MNSFKEKHLLSQVVQRLAMGNHEMAQQAQCIIDRLLRDAKESGGVLNFTGHPLELAFTSNDPTIRYTAEFANNQHPPQARLAQAMAILSEFNQPLPNIEALEAIQTTAALSWGTWLGVRQKPAELPTFKLYVELPPTADGTAWGFSAPAGTVPKALGIDLATGRRELYLEGEQPGMNQGRLLAWLASCGLEARFDELWTAVSDLQRSANQKPGLMPITTYGMSMSNLAEGTPLFSFFTFPDALIGSDWHIRDTLARHAGKTLARYLAVTATLQVGERPLHNAIGWIVLPEHPIQLHIALSAINDKEGGI